MMPSSCCRLSLTTGSAGNAASRRRIASSTGTLAAGSSALNCRDRVLGQALDLGATRHAAPRRVHSVEEIPRRRLAAEQHERSRSAAPRPPREGPRRIPASCAWRGCGRRSRRTIRPMPDRRRRRRPSPRPISLPSGDAGSAPPPGPTLWRMRLRLPRRQLAELLGKRLGVAGELEGFDGEDGGCGVMAVRGAGFGENRVTITSGRNSRITRTMSARTACRSQIRSVSSVVLRVPEVLRAREVLPPAIQPPRGEQLLRAGHAELPRRTGGRAGSVRRRRA